MTAPPSAMLPDADTLARALAPFTAGAPDRALAERLLALCRAQLEAARPALDRVEPADEEAQHSVTLRHLARHG